MDLGRTALACAALGLLAACADGGHEHGEEHGDEHGHEQEAPKSDAHHVAENRRNCEDDVVISAEALVRYGIEVEPVREVVLKPVISAPGHLAFPHGALARVGSAVTGRVLEVRVRSGDRVAQGDTLLVIGSPELGEAQSAYLQKRTVAETAGPALDLAQDQLERSRELYESVQGVALSEVQRREAELRLAERDRQVARADEAAAYSRLLLLGMSERAIQALEESGTVEPRFEIASPIEGRVIEVAVTLGELVGPGNDRLVAVGDLRTLWAIAEVSENRIAEVALGAPARVDVPALAHAGCAATVAATPSVLEPSTRTAEVRLEVPNPDGAMLPGMFIQVEIESSRGGGQPVLVVPDGAVLDIEGQPSVFVPVEPGSGSFCKHAIEVGTPVEEQIPVLAGLEAGQLVVVAGTFRLKAEHGKAAARHEH
jgi:cobalt-zinc-cadmium efflux system membrane fusion protein